jgi:CBS domain-containing protein
VKSLGAIVQDTSRELYTIAADNTAGEAALYMRDRNIGAVAVVDGSRFVGVFSERDLLKRVVAESRDPRTVRIREVMTSELVAAGPDESYEEGLKKMQRARVRHLPILDGNQFIGLISLRDLLRIDAEEKAEEIRMLNTYIHYVPPDRTSGA